MSYRKTPTGNAPKTPPHAGGRQAAGFTLIEMVVAIVVLGVLSAAVGVNWSSFIQHQKLRQDALSLHKEILALKARAVEHNDTAKFIYTANSAYITWRFDETGDYTDPAAVPWHQKAITFNSGIAIYTAVNGVQDLPLLTTNAWESAATGITAEITVKPNNIDAYTNGRILIKSSSAKGEFCIRKDDTSIKPEIYYRSKAGDSWKKA